MKKRLAPAVRIVCLGLVFLLWWWLLNGTFSSELNLAIIAGGTMLVIPAAWLGRIMLDRQPTPERAGWTTTFVHYMVGGLLGAAIIRATVTHPEWAIWPLPIPTGIGLILVILTGAVTLLTVVNLALKGLGAPFAIALSRRLAVDWMYAWTLNPMVLAALAFLTSLGIWYQSSLFVLWVLLLFSPALLFFVKVYEERELEVRFGQGYLDYKARTPFLFPKKPRS